MSWRRTIKFILQGVLLFVFFQYVIGPSTLPPNDPNAKVRFFTRADEFNYVSWTAEAFELKFTQSSLSTLDFLSEEEQRQVVLDYLALVEEIFYKEWQLADIYANPDIMNKEAEADPVSQELEKLYAQRDLLGPLAESVLQNMVAVITSEMGFNPGGQPIPPVLFHSTPLPWALIVSPRDSIRQEANISLEVELTVEDHIVLEQEIATGLDVSTLVVPVGGIGTYPSMIAQTTNLRWIAEVISHEWMHNYLTLRPLGLLYGNSPELRTMNETVASIAGNEIGEALILRFFPKFAPPPPAPATEESTPSPAPPPPVFDFRAEMRVTRVVVDALLEGGFIEEAERYMELRRQFFWDHGYHIRKLNQAYFAFYGAYADEPGGAAGEDPVGAAVRDLRARSDSLVEFIDHMAWLVSFEDLLELLGEVTGR